MQKMERPPYLWGVAAALSAFLLYALTLAPTTAFWDASEYIATAHNTRDSAPAGEPVLHCFGEGVEPSSGTHRVFGCCSNQPFCCSNQCSCDGLFLSGRTSCVMWHFPRPTTSPGGCACVISDRSHFLHGMEPVECQRKGLHPFGDDHRDRQLAGGSMARSRRRAWH